MGGISFTQRGEGIRAAGVCDVQAECGEKGWRKETRGGLQRTFQLRGQRQLLGWVPGAGSLWSVLGRAREMGLWLKPLLVEVGLAVIL